MAEHVSSTPRPAGRILVVEDDVAIAEMLITVLDMEGYSVAWAEAASSAIALLCPDPLPQPPPQPAYDLILLDLQLTDMDGVQIIKHLRQVGCPVPPVLVLSAKTNQAVEAAAQQIGATGVLNKPFLMDALLDTVQQVLAR